MSAQHAGPRGGEIRHGSDFSNSPPGRLRGVRTVVVPADEALPGTPEVSGSGRGPTPHRLPEFQSRYELWPALRLHARRHAQIGRSAHSAVPPEPAGMSV